MESSEFLEAIPGYCGIIVGIWFYFRVARKRKSRKQRFIEKAEKKGCCVTGESIRTKIRSGARIEGDAESFEASRRVTYEYEVNGRKYQKKLTFGYGPMRGYEYPTTITLYYDEKRPSKAVWVREASETEQKTEGCLLTILVVGCAVRIVAGAMKIFF